MYYYAVGSPLIHVMKAFSKYRLPEMIPSHYSVSNIDQQLFNPKVFLTCKPKGEEVSSYKRGINAAAESTSNDWRWFVTG